MKLLTPERIQTMDRINRWRGWTRRDYHVLEHVVIGLDFMADRGYSLMEQRGFALHDCHESEFIGDVPRPDKIAYCNTDFHCDVEAWDRQLCAEQNIPFEALSLPGVREVDNLMMYAEHDTVAIPNDPTLEYDCNDTNLFWLRRMIDTGHGYDMPRLFWQHHRRLWG